MEQNYLRTSVALSIATETSKHVTLHDVSQGEYDLLIDFLKFLRSSKFGKYQATVYYDPKNKSKKVDVENSERLRHTIN